ncbi:cupin-like domain-containing protein [Nostoc sp. C057]|uniref:cupin-like domain-containing protein n=1 Tax=Nostoc sp. C057 TaxID=2576903 RepID=UPI0015C362B8|nr:cupin-like domain-containing protein [Nostoc sp. C057]QLE49532.1 cupin-like domain-containing protein [Nostoc sp. C057]
MTMQLPLSFYEISELIFLTITLIVFARLIIYILKRTWQKQKLKLVWTPINVVERRSNLSYNEFIQEYVSMGKPVIITDVIQNWKAVTKWTLDFFKSECGTIECAVKEDKDEVDGLMTIADYIDYITIGNSERRLYLANWFISDYPQLLEDYKEPIYFPNWLQRLPRKLLKKYELDNPELFIGHKDTSIGLHKDPNNGSAWLGMIRGRKQIVLFTPDQEKFLYSGKVDVFNPNLENFPLYAKTNSIEIILEAGEILYIPPNWWHHVRNLENTIAVGSLLLNEWNSELFFQSICEKNPVKGHLLPLVLEFPWLGKALFAIGVI